MSRPFPSDKRSLQQRLDDGSVLDPRTGCRLWTRPRNDGYGSITVSGRTMRAHRAAWTVRHGPIPNGLFVCHHCDTPACINADHLFLGTHAANMVDRALKIRARKKGLIQPVKRTMPDLVRLEIMGREILLQALVVRPLEQSVPPQDDPPAAAEEPRKPIGAAQE